MAKDIANDALSYHRIKPHGKLAISATKPLASQKDLAMAYSPGVALPCLEIANDPANASLYTARSNLVAVISNGTAVLGLGNIGPLASKPVMEGKAVLFKKFSGIDVFDIEINETDADKLTDIIASLEPTFGGINLEDIKAPECFKIEKELKQRLSIPVMHDDQHGTAIIVAAAIHNGLEIVGKSLDQVKLVTSGAGAAALACLQLLVRMGLPRENITVTDIHGVVYQGRELEMDEYKQQFAQATDLRTIDQVITDADIFLGLSAGNILKPEMVKKMAQNPLILALANPDPEIKPELVREVRADAIIATGRSDYPNQVNNVLCFPYLFRGALDVGATTINDEMKLACVYALAELARAESTEVVYQAYGGVRDLFGRDYIIPKPFDPRLISCLAPTVAQTAMETGVACRPIEDLETYRLRLDRFVFRSGILMQPIIATAKRNQQRIAFAQGEGHRTLQAVQQVVDEQLAIPIVIGHADVIERRIKKLGLRISPGRDFEIFDPSLQCNVDKHWRQFHKILGRRGVSPEEARTEIRAFDTISAALMLERGDVDAMLCGSIGPFRFHLHHIRNIIGLEPGSSDLSTLSALILPTGTYFVCDIHVTADPDAKAIADMTYQAVDEIRKFGIEPRVALLSHSNYGTHNTPSAIKMRKAYQVILSRDPDFEVDGEMHADAALSEQIRKKIFPQSPLSNIANLLIMPSIDAAHISYNLLKELGNGVTVGPILVGAAKPVHIMTNSTTAKGIANMSALAAASAHLKSRQN